MKIPSVHAATRAVCCSPHQRSWRTCCILHLCRDPPANFSNEKGIGIENQQEGKKDIIPTGGRERRRGREGGKEGRKEGRQKQRPSSRMLRALSHLHMLLSKSCGSQAICKCWFQNVAKTVQFTDFISKCYEHSTVCRFFASERREHHSAVFRYDSISCKYHGMCRC